MIATDALLIKLVLLIDILPQPKKRPRRGRPDYYPEALFLKALVIMTVRGLYKPNTLLAVLAEPQMQPLRAILTDAKGCFPCRRTWERRLERIPKTLPERIGLLGRLLVKQIVPWHNHGRAVAMDSTILHASWEVTW